MEGIGATWGFRIAKKRFRSGIQDGHHGSHFENLKSHLLSNGKSLEFKLDGRHWGVMEIQNC